MRQILLLTVCSTACFAQSGALRGIVRDARTGEALGRVAVQLAGEARQTLTGADGGFDLGAVAGGPHLLKFSTVGYRLLQTPITVASPEVQWVEASLTPESLDRTDRAEVRANPFDPVRTSGPTEFGLEGNEAKNLAGVLTDDPLRAVQSLPGVSSNDDFDSRFSIHGAPYTRVGLYLDDILLHMPFHTVQGEGPSGSLTVFNGDVVEHMSLETEGYGPKFENRTAGALDVRTRDGSRSQTSLRVTAGAPDAGVMAEGPIGSGARGSWLVSARKSYLQYLVKAGGDEPTMAFGFTDLQAEGAYDLAHGSTIRVKAIDGTSNFDRSDARDRLALNTSMIAGYRFTLGDVSWELAPSSTFLLNTHLAWLRERYDDTNRDGNVLASGYHSEWTAKTSGSWSWTRGATLEFGALARHVRGDGFADYYYDAASHARVEGYRGATTMRGGYAQQSWNFAQRLFVSAGSRWDNGAVSPQTSVTVLPWRSTRLQVTWGQYAQFPDEQSLYSVYGNRRLLPERATHLAAAVEQRLGPQARLRVTAYRRRDRDLLFRPWLESRLASDGAILTDNFQAPLSNSVSGESKGVEFVLQRRTANRLTGWISYALGWARMRDGVTGARFAADQDQRHTANVYLGYRLRPSVHISARWTYGSGFPIPGYFRRDGDGWALSRERNQARLDPYQRTDVRVNKSRTFDRWKLTVFAEVVNVLNRPNYRFDSYNGHDESGRAFLSLSRMFPVLPSAGLMVEF